MKLTDVDVFHLLVDAGRAVDGDGRLRQERWLLADHWEREEQKQLEKAQEEAGIVIISFVRGCSTRSTLRLDVALLRPRCAPRGRNLDLRTM